MYFEDRIQAGAKLGDELVQRYRYENCVVVALNDGGVIVGEQIASKLHCILTMLLTEDIAVPGEDMSFGAVSQAGGFTYNGSFTQGQIDEYVGEYHGYLEEQKREAFQKINRLIGDGGVLEMDMLRHHVVILVSDAFDVESSIDVAIDFLKPVHVKRLIIATPIASITAVDKLHVLADELQILSVKENYMGVNHYYERNELPSHEHLIAKLNENILNWE